MEQGLIKQDNQALAILSQVGTVILREHKDKAQSVEFIAQLLNRVAKLYQIPNWDNTNAVLLAKFIMDKYSCETLDVIVKCLESPPSTGERNWRLTPDTIQIWFELKLDEQRKEWEDNYQKEKKRLKELEADPQTNWPDFKKLLSGTWYEDAEKERNIHKETQDFKLEYLAKKKQQQEQSGSSLDDFCEKKGDYSEGNPSQQDNGV